MTLVLAIEPDASQSGPLATVVRAKLGAKLQVVTTPHAAEVAMNQHVPDIVLLGHELPQELRTRVVTHFRSLTPDDSHACTLDIPKLDGAPSLDAFEKTIGACLAAAEEARVREMASVMGEAADPAWDSIALDDDTLPAAPVASAPAAVPESPALDDDDALRVADVEFIEAEVEFRLRTELERLRNEAALARAEELARVEERAAAEASAREQLAAELERVRRESEEKLAADIARARVEADEAKRAAIDEARAVVQEAAARARMAEEEVERVRREAEAQLKAAMLNVRAEGEAQLQEQVARARAETEARLEAQLAAVMSQAEQLRHAQQENADADKIRLEAAQAARAAAEAALAAETARIRAEAEAQLEAEIARIRAEAAPTIAAAPQGRELSLLLHDEADEEESALAQASRSAIRGIRWDFVATAAVIVLVIVAGVLYLPRAVSTAARTSSTLVGTAGKAARNVAKEAAAAAPVVTRRALTAAERAIPRRASADTTEDAAADSSADASDAGAVAADAAPDAAAPGFLTLFSRIPMDVYIDGRRSGTTNDGQVMLKSGPHRVEFASDRFRYRSSTTLTIRPGAELPYTVPLPSADVRITTTPGAEVFVEGERVGVAPLETIEVPIGTREIVVKDATGESRQAIEVKYGQTNEISLVPVVAEEEAAPAVPRLAPLTR